MHLPDEAALGGPVQYRWMYLFERYMYHLKKKVRNKAHIAGSIIFQCLTEEISRASAHHFGNPEVPATVLQPGDIHFISFLIRGFEAHQQTIGGHVRKLCLEGFEKLLKMLLLRYKMIHTTKLLHQVKCYDLKLMLWKMI